MGQPNPIQEPPIDPLADTNPSLTIRQVQLESRSETAVGWQRAAGFASLLGAAVLTAAAALLIFLPVPAPAPAPTDAPQNAATNPAPPTEAAIVPTPIIVPADPGTVPTLPPDAAAILLGQPVATAVDDDPIAIERDNYTPFTIVKQERPRNEVISYTATQGDTIYTIAERFKIKPESLAWSNNRRIVLVLRPGDVLNIPPVDGVYVQVVGSKTIAQWAAQYKVQDPYVVIDSEYNNIAGSTPDTILPSGTWIFIPGGQGEDITWNPGVTVEQGTGARQGFVTSFAPGDPGSCGNVDNPGGGAAWVNPLPGGTYVRGFSSFHPGIDLSAPPGTPIRAANSGAVIFAGWNSWGYGNTVVLAHGPFLTLYGHMSSIAVRCGQLVPAGSVIGGVGSTGNSSGPHLHFEIRNGQTQTDPLATIPNLGL